MIAVICTTIVCVTAFLCVAVIVGSKKQSSNQLEPRRAERKSRLFFNAGK